MIVYALVALALYIGGNAYVFYRLLQAIAGVPQGLRIAFIVIYWFAAIAMFLALGLRNIELPLFVQRMLYVVGSVWLVFILYMVISVALFDVVHLIFPSFQGGVWYALCITSMLLVCGYVNYRHPRVEHITITTDKMAAGDRMRIVAISDVHLGHGTGREQLSRYVELINEQRPDVVVIVGDLIDNSITPVVEANMEEVLSEIEAPSGIYMVPGNHEYISGLKQCSDFMNRTNILLLQDTVLALPKGVELICRDDRMNKRRKPLAELVNKCDSSHFTVVLDHQPYDIAASDALGVDLHISGHTHHGQIWPISLLTDFMYDQSHGYRKWRTTHAFVSSGLSLWGPPFRIGTRSDLAVIDIVGSDAEL